MGERDLLATLREVRDDMIADLMDRLRTGKINARNFDSQRESKFKRAKAAKAALAKVVRSVGARGMEHVRDELRRQADG